MIFRLILHSFPGKEKFFKFYNFQSTNLITLRVCSHEPETVNYPGVMIALGQRLTSSDHYGFI